MFKKYVHGIVYISVGQIVFGFFPYCFVLFFSFLKLASFVTLPWGICVCVCVNVNVVRQGIRFKACFCKLLVTSTI